MNSKTQSIEIDIYSEIDHKLAANFIKCYKKNLLRKIWLMIQPPLAKKFLFKNKIEANRI